MTQSRKNTSSTFFEQEPVEQASFAQQCETLYCANETQLSKNLYHCAGSIPKANETWLAEVNELIAQQNDWFFEILQQYRLNSKEGLLLMSLAEALLRIPDQQGVQALFHDRLHRGHWLNDKSKHSLLAKALQWLGEQTPIDKNNHASLLNKISQKGAIEICTLFIEQMSQRFVFAQNLDDALLRSRKLECHEACSFDMLGEAALTYDEADEYFSQYQKAITTVGQYNKCLEDTPHEVSIKLSALHPRYQPEKYKVLKQELLPKLHYLCQLAKKNNVLLTLDAEEQYRLELSIKLLRELLNFKENKIDNIGIAVQTYGKRALATIEELSRLSAHYQCEIRIRLVKGAYWDYEIKSAQQLGLIDYPVWSEKQLSDDNYLICAAAILKSADKNKSSNLVGQFASHNPETLLQLQQLHSSLSLQQPLKQPLQLQRLHGMGELQHAFMADNFSSQTRVYCPVGESKILLPYLVRRLIENGANSSFLYPQVANEKTPLIHKPSNILDYRNSISYDIRQDHHFHPLQNKLKTYISLKKEKDITIEKMSRETIQCIGNISAVGLHTILSTEDRIKALNKWADALEKEQDALIIQLILEAGKTYQDAIDEVREACDFCRYYAKQAQKLFSHNKQRPSITGELNQLSYKGKGIAVCISPWNFPLAIFVGQIAAAWVSGNSVIAKPAQQTLNIAQTAINLAHKSGIDHDQLQIVHCHGPELIPALLAEKCVQLVCFTGSTVSAKSIQQTLAAHDGPIIPLIAETGGQNVLIADSSALIDQLVPDIIESAFYSAGQRCSALRVAYIQQDIFNDFCHSLKGNMQTLIIGDPTERETDIGPIIDDQALKKLERHQLWLQDNGRLIARCTLPTPEEKTQIDKRLFAPCAYQIESLEQIKEENFGPILHVIPYAQSDLQQVIADINHSGYGLTMGLHSRNQDWLDNVISQVNIGNIYINRNTVGAKVSSQPFGGHGLSGTGPKAGGPNYLNAMVDEYTVTTNITAWGGNPELL